jgi:hypothetical protein
MIATIIGRSHHTASYMMTPHESGKQWWRNIEARCPERRIAAMRADVLRCELEQAGGDEMCVGLRIRAGCLALLVVVFAAPWAAPPCKAASGPEIEAEVQATLDEFFRKVGFARALGNRAVAILVFPTVVKAGFGIGGEYGEGALLSRYWGSGRRTVEQTRSIEIGVEIQAVSRLMIYVQACFGRRGVPVAAFPGSYEQIVSGRQIRPLASSPVLRRPILPMQAG